MNAIRTFIWVMTVALSLAVPAVNAQLVCQHAPDPIMITGAIGAGDLTQTGRITRDGVPSTCSGGAANLENTTVVRRDAYNFSNPFSETVCVRVDQDFTSCANNQLMSEAYSSYNPAAPASSVIGKSGFSTIGTGSYSFSVGPNANFTIVVNEADPNTGCGSYKLKITYLKNCRSAGFDVTNDGKADPTVYRTSSISQWYSLDSATNQLVSRNFGTVGDLVTGGSDYTGDGRTDLSLYRLGTSTWYYGLDQNSPDTNFAAVQFGLTNDKPVEGDYDGDGVNDIAVWRPSDGNYYYLQSSDGTFKAFHWGQNSDIPVFGDFDGDNISDFAVVRQTSGGSTWYIRKSNYRGDFIQTSLWGLPTDKLVPADYDGDGITDLAVWRPSQGAYYVLRSSDLALQGFQWGIQGDTPQPADFDGDKKADFAVYRSSAQEWYIYNSGTGTFRSLVFGLPNDIPVSAPFRVQ